MNVMELGAIGELVGGVAVVGSLLFVGIQLRQTAATLRATSSYDAIARFVDMNKYLIDDPGFAVVTTRLEVGEAIDMDEGTQARLSYLLRSAFQYMAAQQYLHRRGLFDDAVWNRYLDYARRIVSTPAGSDWWTEEKRRAPYSPEFVAALEARK